MAFETAIAVLRPPRGAAATCSRGQHLFNRLPRQRRRRSVGPWPVPHRSQGRSYCHTVASVRTDAITWHIDRRTSLATAIACALVGRSDARPLTPGDTRRRRPPPDAVPPNGSRKRFRAAPIVNLPHEILRGDHGRVKRLLALLLRLITQCSRAPAVNSCGHVPSSRIGATIHRWSEYQGGGQVVTARRRALPGLRPPADRVTGESPTNSLVHTRGRVCHTWSL